MASYVVDLPFPGSAQLTPAEVDVIAQRARRLVEELGPGLTWVGGYVIDGGVRAVYDADDEDLVRSHAARMGLDVTSVHRVLALIDVRSIPRRKARQ